MTILNDDESANAELKRTMDVNFMGAVYCTREAYKSMMKRNAYGYIININSIDGHYVSHAHKQSVRVQSVLHMPHRRRSSVKVFINFIYNLQVPLPTTELVSYNTYAPSKFAITALNEVLRHELTWEGNKKIRVSSLSPGKENEGERKQKPLEQ